MNDLVVDFLIANFYGAVIYLRTLYVCMYASDRPTTGKKLKPNENQFGICVFAILVVLKPHSQFKINHFK